MGKIERFFIRPSPGPNPSAVFDTMRQPQTSRQATQGDYVVPVSPLAISLRQSLLLTTAIVLAGAVSHLATFSHASPALRLPAVFAVVGVLFVSVPSLWFWTLISNGAARQMGSITWRFLGALLLLGMAAAWQESARNCYFSVLLPCYFVALSLESWLLIRQCKLTAC